MSDWQRRCRVAADSLPTAPVTSRWFDVSQAAIDSYMHSVSDKDPTHLDPAWARANTPYAGTIAPGMWIASLLVAMLQDTGAFTPIERALGVSFGLNYGFDRLRFVSAVAVGSRVRAHFSNPVLQVRDEQIVLICLDATVEIEKQARPALAAKWRLAFLRPAANSTGDAVE